ncbi:S8 family serine peptidase [Candidatus Kapabacteria bacterium]|nr:S8 family serine peptidase [Candidatus Kapabacteria bacterium]
MKQKIILFLILIFPLTLIGKSYLIIPKNNYKKELKSFLPKSKVNRNRLLTSKQQSKIEFFQSLKLIDEAQLSNLDEDSYVVYEGISKLYIEQTAIPNDPQFPDQWSMQTTNAYISWEYATGDGVLVAVIDTGIDYNHEDLKDNLWINTLEDFNANGTFEPWSKDSIFEGLSGDFDGIDNDGNGFADDVIGYDFIDQDIANFGDYLTPDPNPEDEQDHGTLVSGIISAKNNNGLGITGSAYDSKLMTLRAFDAGGEGESDDVARCIIYAAMNGARVINMSFGESFKSPIVADACEFAYSMGCVLVASSGNNNNFRTHYPSDLPEVISVAGTNQENRRYGFSNYGSYIDISAPGNDVLTTNRNNEYKRVNGTSFSAPFIAGASALLLEKNPDLSPSRVKSILQNSSFDLGENGWDVYFGSGIVDFRKAVLSTINSDFSISSPQFEENININNLDSIEINGTISIPLMESVDVFLGKGHFPDNLSNTDLDYIIDSLNTIDSLNSINNNTIYNPRTRQNFIDPPSNEIEAFKWDSVFSSDDRYLDELMFKLPSSSLKDTSYTLRFVVKLINSKTIEKRIKFYAYDSTTNLKIESAKSIDMLYNGKVRNLVYAVTNKESVMEVNSPQFKKLNNNYRTKAHAVIIDEQLTDFSSVNLNFARNGQESTTMLLPVNSNHFVSPTETFKRISDTYPFLYLFDEGIDYDSDGNPDFIFNDLSSLSIGTSLHFEYEDDELKLKNNFEQAWLPVGYGDTDGDGLSEVLTTAGFEFRLFEENSDGSNPFETLLYSDDNSFRWAEGMFDFDGDGLDEIILNDEFSYYILSLIDGKYQEIARTSLPPEYANFGNERFGIAGDFNKDGTNQLSVTNNLGHLLIYEYLKLDNQDRDSLVLIQNFDETVSFSRQFLKAADLDGDGIDEIISLNNGSSGIFPETQSSDRFWRLRVFKSTNGLYTRYINKYIYGVQDGLLGNTGISYKNGLAVGDLNDKTGEEIVVSTFPNLYVLTLKGDDLEPIWHVPNALSNSAIIYDFNKNGVNDLGITTFRGFEIFEFDANNTIPQPKNFEAYAINESSALLNWDPLNGNYLYEVFRFTGEDNQVVKVAETTEPFIIIDDLDNNTLYRFVVRACENDNCGDFSNEIGEAFTHTPLSIIDVNQIDGNKILVKYSGKISLDNPAPSLFSLDQEDGNLKPISITTSSDSTLYIKLDGQMSQSSATIFADSFRDYYNTPTEISSFVFDVNVEQKTEELYIKSFEVQGSSLLSIEFSEEVDFGSSNQDNYIVTPFGSVLSVNPIPTELQKVQLILSTDASYSRGKEYVLEVRDIFAKSGKPITKGVGSTISFSFSQDLLESVYLYPHPVERSKSEYYFANLTKTARIIILTYDGVAIKELIENDGNGGVEWDGTDLNGKFLEPGIYFWKAIDEEGGYESRLHKMFVK